jgi:protein O-GlcNAc transferase
MSNDSITEAAFNAHQDNPLLASIEAAMLRMNEGDLDGALAECEQAMKSNPEAAEPYFVMGVVAIRCGDRGQALKMFEAAHRLDPETREYCEALGVIHSELGKLADGLYYAKLAMGLEPHELLSRRMPGSLRDLAAAYLKPKLSMHRIEAERLFNIGEYELARRECEAEIRLNPRNGHVYFLLGRINHALGRHEQAVGAYQAALHLAPEDNMILARMARSLVAFGRFIDASAVARQALRQAPDDPEVFAVAMDALLRCPHLELETCRELALEHRRRITANLADELAPPPVAASGKVRVGVLSNAFFRTPDVRPILAWLKGGDRAPVAFRGYTASPAKDVVTTGLRSLCEEWRDIYDLDPFTLGITLRSEELDVLVDLMVPDGHTIGGVAAMEPAPVRISALALPEPSLMPGVTHVLSDETLAEVDRATLLEGQQLLEVPGTLFACEPCGQIPQDLPPPHVGAGHVTFGGVADLARLTPDCAALWAEVLQSVPGSRLLLCAPQPPSSGVRSRLVEMFSNVGVADRLLFPTEEAEAPRAGDSQYLPLAQIEGIDVFLDTTPISGERELPECLWAGIPVISLMGERRLGAIGASILAAARRVDWIARDREAFVRIATGLATDPDVLTEARANLQASIANTRLFKTSELARNIAGALKQAGEAARQKLEGIAHD